jgi:hypothetical protein
MKELTSAQMSAVSGGASKNIFDSIGGAVIGAAAGAMGVAWSCYNVSTKSPGLSGILAPVQAVIGGTFGAIWGGVFGLVGGLATGIDEAIIRAEEVWDNINNAG